MEKRKKFEILYFWGQWTPLSWTISRDYVWIDLGPIVIVWRGYL